MHRPGLPSGRSLATLQRSARRTAAVVCATGALTLALPSPAAWSTGGQQESGQVVAAVIVRPPVPVDPVVPEHLNGERGEVPAPHEDQCDPDDPNPTLADDCKTRARDHGIFMMALIVLLFGAFVFFLMRVAGKLFRSGPMDQPAEMAKQARLVQVAAET